jgi:DNA-binding HxlR family transcriptional regulator
MRSYDQYCSLARALDIVGDRWTLLVVRELLVRPCRYADLQAGLPGIATNLLAERLRLLEDAGVVGRDAQGRYELTGWGRRLAVPVRELARWGAPLMQRKAETDAFRGSWFALPVAMMFGGTDPGRPDLAVEIRSEGETVSMVSKGGVVSFRPGPASRPDLVVSGPPDAIIGLLSGRLSAEAAAEHGVTILGDARNLDRLRQPGWLSGAVPGSVS